MKNNHLYHSRPTHGASSRKLSSLFVNPLRAALHRMRTAGVALVTAFLLINAAIAAPSGSDVIAIEYMIDYVGKADVVFVRNFSDHNAQRAMRHMQDKYDHFQDEIDSPEEFIELCASKSLLTGRDYRIVDAQGHESTSRDWMLGLLDDYRSLRAQSGEE